MLIKGSVVCTDSCVSIRHECIGQSTFHEGQTIAALHHLKTQWFFHVPNEQCAEIRNVPCTDVCILETRSVSCSFGCKVVLCLEDYILCKVARQCNTNATKLCGKSMPTGNTIL